MKEKIKELAVAAKLEHCVTHVRLEDFADRIIDECCMKLMSMDENANGNHNYYKHAALELVRHFKDKE
jgi:hypothetical protein